MTICTTLDGIERLSMVIGLLVVALFFYRLSRLLMRQSVSSMDASALLWGGKEAEGDNKDQRYQILHSFFILNLGATLC